jgi:hypothetical protein
VTLTYSSRTLRVFRSVYCSSSSKGRPSLKSPFLVAIASTESYVYVLVLEHAMFSPKFNVTNSMQRKPSWETGSRYVHQEIPHFFFSAVSDEFRMAVPVIRPGSVTLRYMLIPNQTNHNYIWSSPVSCPLGPCLQVLNSSACGISLSYHSGLKFPCASWFCRVFQGAAVWTVVRKGDNPFRSSHYVPCLEQWCLKTPRPGRGWLLNQTGQLVFALTSLY